MTELRKVLKLRTVISTSSGMAIATSCYLAGIQVATIVAGELAWVSILVAGLSVPALVHVLFGAHLALPDGGGHKALHPERLSERAAIS